MSHIRESILYDDDGNPIGVVVPYERWLRAKAAAKSGRTKAKRTFRAAELKGKLSWPADPVEFQRQVRQECP